MTCLIGDDLYMGAARLTAHLSTKRRTPLKLSAYMYTGRGEPGADLRHAEGEYVLPPDEARQYSNPEPPGLAGCSMSVRVTSFSSKCQGKL